MVVFPPLSTEQRVDVTLNDDQLLEGDEDFTGTLSLPSGSRGVTLGLRSAIANIIDDDGKA